MNSEAHMYYLKLSLHYLPKVHTECVHDMSWEDKTNCFARFRDVPWLDNRITEEHVDDKGDQWHSSEVSSSYIG